jgi:hypothetical protein
MTGVVGSTFGGYLTGYILSGGKPSAGWGAARSGAISSFLSAALTAYTPLDKDYNISELRNDPERLSQMQNAQTLTVSTPQFNDLGDIQWNAIALLLGGGYSHAWHTQDSVPPTAGYAKFLTTGVQHREIITPEHKSYNLFTNNCSTRFGSLHPGHLASRYGYMHRTYNW